MTRLVIVGLLALASVVFTGATFRTSTFINPQLDPSGSSAWGQTYYDGGHEGYNPKEKTIGKTNAPSLKLLWAASVAGGVTGFAIDKNIVFAQGQGSGQDILVALHAATGKVIWTVTTGNNGFTEGGTVATGNGLVFVGCSVNESNQMQGICAYKESNGQLVWSDYTDCNCAPPAALMAPLDYDSNTVYFGYETGGGSQTHGIYAVSAAGGPLWGFGQFNNSWGVGEPAAAKGYVYAESGENPAIYALSASSGTEVWSSAINQSSANVTVSGGVVYASVAYTGTDATLEALNGTNGATLWTFTYASNFAGGAMPPQPVAVAKNVVYLSGVDGDLYAINAKTGKVIWSLGDSQSTNKVTSAPSVANGVVYVSGGNYQGGEPNTTAYNAENGTLLWASPSNHGSLITPPEVVNGVLYLASPGDSICESICAYAPKK